MGEYIATFMTGFQSVVRKELVKDLPGASVRNVYDGLIHFRYNGSYQQICRLPYLNNIFYVIRSFRGNPSFARMAEKGMDQPAALPIRKGTFRVRFSEANQFVSVPKNITRRVEAYIQEQSDLVIDRVDPQVEIWFLKRSGGEGFFGELLFKRQATEKNLRKGELRPELVSLMLCMAHPGPETVVSDPFAGYGAIPRQLVGRVRELYISDLDPAMAAILEKEFETLENEGTLIHVSREDALQMPGVEDRKLDQIITDPPWGYYEEIESIEEFYEAMLCSFRKKLKPEGTAVVLSARKEELETAAGTTGFCVLERVDTLVNGKKAGVYLLKQA